VRGHKQIKGKLKGKSVYIGFMCQNSVRESSSYTENVQSTSNNEKVLCFQKEKKNWFPNDGARN
jgi:hypothetical protein